MAKGGERRVGATCCTLTERTETARGAETFAANQV